MNLGTHEVVFHKVVVGDFKNSQVRAPSNELFQKFKFPHMSRLKAENIVLCAYLNL